MASSISDLFDCLAPELADSTSKNCWIEIATGLTSSSYFDDQYNLAIALRSAHIGTISSSTTSAGGPISSMREGDLAISYAVGKVSSSGLGSTKYGIMLDNLIKSCGAGISVSANCSSNSTILF